MALIIGIDVGGSTTKIVGLSTEGNVVRPMTVRAEGPLASLYGAFGKYLDEGGLRLTDVSRVMVTGVGSSAISSPLFGVSTATVDEFTADGLGAAYGLPPEVTAEPLVVVSMGTGTTLVEYRNGAVRHIGGLSMGGGTLVGLSSLLLRTTDIAHVVELAAGGSLAKVNLTIGDICHHALEGLPPHATASLFGKVPQTSPTEADVALGLICMVLETIGSAAVLSQQGTDVRRFVLIGNLTQLPQCGIVYPLMADLYGVEFIMSQWGGYATALGAALAAANHAFSSAVVSLAD